MSYNRYANLTYNGKVELPPYVTYTPKYTDKEEVWELNKSRLDLISYKYYGDANYDWLILLANEDIPFLEFEIPNGTILTIPYPLEEALQNITRQIEKFKTFYGFD